MTVPSNTHQTYQTVGIREDLSDIISRIDPTEVPFTSNIGRTKATQPRHDGRGRSDDPPVELHADRRQGGPGFGHEPRGGLRRP
jgi:hypothetical protein